VVEVAMRRERHWQPAVAVLLLILLPMVLPDKPAGWPKWVLPWLGVALLAAVVISDVAGVSRRARPLRLLEIAITLALIVSAAAATLDLVADLVHGGAATSSATALLSTGLLVWINNNVVFALLYWEVDTGGPGVREQHHPVDPVDFAFPQHMNPEVMPPGWRPVFTDYLYLGLTNAAAFSPTDVMPLTSTAKLTMAAQSLISMVVLSLVIARAVNILT
jgi:uncharacterized membrane protein